MEERLFDVEPFTIFEVPSVTCPELVPLGVKLDQIIGVPSKLLEVTIKPGSKIYEYEAGTLMSRYTDIYEYDEDNHMTWVPTIQFNNDSLRGFLTGAFSLNDEAGTPILHLLPWCTDMDTSQAVRLCDIANIAEYPENVAGVLAAYQNALVDGNTYDHQRYTGLSTEVIVEVEDLEPFINGYWWPEPTVIYSAENPV